MLLCVCSVLTHTCSKGSLIAKTSWKLLCHKWWSTLFGLVKKEKSDCLSFFNLSTQCLWLVQSDFYGTWLRRPSRTSWFSRFFFFSGLMTLLVFWHYLFNWVPFWFFYWVVWHSGTCFRVFLMTPQTRTFQRMFPLRK